MTTPTYANDREAIEAVLAIYEAVKTRDKVARIALELAKDIRDHLSRVVPPKPAAPSIETELSLVRNECEVLRDAARALVDHLDKCGCPSTPAYETALWHVKNPRAYLPERASPPKPASPVISADKLLPCDVRLPPCTTIRKGCTLGTLFDAMTLEGRPSFDEPHPSDQSQAMAMAMLRRLIPIARHEDYCSGGLNEACDCALGDAMELTRDDTPSGPAPGDPNSFAEGLYQRRLHDEGHDPSGPAQKVEGPAQAVDHELEERSRLRREARASGAKFYVPAELHDAQAVSVHLGFGEIISNWRQTLDKRARLTGGDIHRLTVALLSGQASQIKLMYQALVAVKVRSHFIGWANESKWTMPDPKGGSQSISIPDWREELTLVEAALNLADGHTVVTHGEHPAHGEPTLEQIDRNVQARIDAGAVFATEEEALTALNAPVPIQIQCPKCQTWHVDEAEWATRPHRTHQCQSCKHEWRPFEYRTVGVAPTLKQRIDAVMKNQAISDILAGNSTFGDRQAVAALSVAEGAASSRPAQVNPALLSLLEASRSLLPLTTGRVHDLKCHPDAFQAMWEKRKTLEFRNDDRRFRVGDIILNREWMPLTQSFSGRTMRFLITHKLRGGEFGVPQGYCALSVVPAPAIIARTESTP